ncbi:hypothetical protein K469DRAFT_698617 [Zopfia rhizophila CBS 207.26]|uniref:Uncharacterized protein n=1 Tax=Zopfia rhizophila CBS 207.26 TaxID=1314779 RepID=A0A6A6EYT1_9PEZI|nr:hypothetical protein K469DRAFT_698617 [Zopfia rhizophila CBS 207.26]
MRSVEMTLLGSCLSMTVSANLLPLYYARDRCLRPYYALCVMPALLCAPSTASSAGVVGVVVVVGVIADPRRRITESLNVLYRMLRIVWAVRRSRSGLVGADSAPCRRITCGKRGRRAASWCVLVRENPSALLYRQQR